jgi:hypothetical protein
VWLAIHRRCWARRHLMAVVKPRTIRPRHITRLHSTMPKTRAPIKEIRDTLGGPLARRPAIALAIFMMPYPAPPALSTAPNITRRGYTPALTRNSYAHHKIFGVQANIARYCRWRNGLCYKEQGWLLGLDEISLILRRAHCLGQCKK